MKKKKDLFIGCFNKSVILTYVGVIFSILGIFILMTNKEYESIDRIGISMSCLIFAGICDLFDGFIARKCKRTDIQKSFGIQIDTLCDIISFINFPVIILYRISTFYNSHIMHLTSNLIIIIYIFSGITRLAWFNILANNENKLNYYQGLPVTFISLILPICYVIIQRVTFFWQNINIIFTIIYFIVSILFILNIKIKKPTGIWYAVFSILAVITLILLLV